MSYLDPTNAKELKLKLYLTLDVTLSAYSITLNVLAIDHETLEQAKSVYLKTELASTEDLFVISYLIVSGMNRPQPSNVQLMERLLRISKDREDKERGKLR